MTQIIVKPIGAATLLVTSVYYGQVKITAERVRIRKLSALADMVKFIGEKIKQWEKDGKHTYVFGFEESCGYLRGTHARDKDAVVASMLCAEMVCYYTYIGKSVYGRLQEIYAKYGYVLDKNVSIQYSGLNAMKEMNAVVNALKTLSVEEFAGVKVLGKVIFAFIFLLAILYFPFCIFLCVILVVN